MCILQFINACIHTKRHFHTTCYNHFFDAGCVVSRGMHIQCKLCMCCHACIDKLAYVYIYVYTLRICTDKCAYNICTYIYIYTNTYTYTCTCICIDARMYCFPVISLNCDHTMAAAWELRKNDLI